MIARLPIRSLPLALGVAFGWLLTWPSPAVRPAPPVTPLLQTVTRQMAETRVQAVASPLFSPAPVSLWSYSWAVAAVEDVAQLPEGAPFRRLLPTLLAGFDAYWDGAANPPAYAPYPHPSATTVKFFDDNAWTGLDLVTAYRLTHNPRYLHQAEAVFRYEQSGWDPQGGGIFWNDQRRMRNTPANAPTAQLAAELYAETHRAAYLQWAIRIQRWETQHLVNPRTGAVYDHISATGHLGRRTLSYNQGSVIGADVALYQVTHHPTYLHQAEKTARFASQNLAFSTARPLSVAFAGVLADNLHQLWKVTHAPTVSTTVSRLASAISQPAPSEWAGDPMHHLLWESGAIRVTAAVRAVVVPHRSH
ncbi:MAG: glycoside hydrolase family 76 protein [Firmicutes bacterium]|nr:glycoside hydrolase family 76 protein [Bacillota bacterium]